MTAIDAPLVTADEADLLNQARRTLTDIMHRAQDVSRDLADCLAYDTPGKAQSLGRLCEAAEAGENAVFHTLNIAASHCDSREAADAIEREFAEAREAREAKAAAITP